MPDSRFDAAVAVAMSQGRLDEPTSASRSTSGEDWDGFVLRRENGEQICLIPFEEIDGEGASALIPVKSRFEAAVELAIARGRIRSSGLPCEEKSQEKYGEYMIRSEGNVIVARILSRDIDAILSGKATPTPPGRTRVQSDENTAKAWARSMGYPVPTKPDGCLTTVFVFIGLLAAVVPGLLIFGWLLMKQRDYERDIKLLVAKWVDAGRPEPGVKSVNLEELPRSAESASQSTEKRLVELQSMKEKGLISDEEYDSLRKKALGL